MRRGNVPRRSTIDAILAAIPGATYEDGDGWFSAASVKVGTKLSHNAVRNALDSGAIPVKRRPSPNGYEYFLLDN